MIYTAYSDTEKALEEVKEFLFSDRKEHIVAGGAGTGKSVLIDRIITRIFPEYQQLAEIIGIPYLNYVSVTATTNSACNQLIRSDIPINKVTTIHNALGITLKKDYETGKLKYTSFGHTKLSNILIIIDEASMIDPLLHKILIDNSPNSKILYVGDWDQLLGVKGTLPNYNLITTSHLTEIKRTSSPHLKKVYQDLKKGVNTNKFPQIKLLPSVVDWISDPDEVLRVFLSDPDNTVIGAYTNTTVNNINSVLRAELGYTGLYSQGEALIVTSPNKLSGLHTEQKVRVKSYLDEQELTFSDEDGEVEITLKCHTYIVQLDDYSQNETSIRVCADDFEYQALLKTLIKNKQFAAYFFLKDRISEVRPVYASTCHKLQGITTKTVMLSLTDIFTCRKPNDILRMLYVGVSRAKEHIVFFGDLPHKYKNLLIP